MLERLTYRRADGTFVGVVNGGPYHITPDEPYWGQAQEMALDEMPPLEPQEIQEDLSPEQVLKALPPVSRVQMLAALVDFEIITEAEAVGWLGGDLPAVVQAAIDGLPEGARLVATLRAKAQTSVDPSDPLVAALAASKDMGLEAIVLLFGHAAGL